MTQNRRTKAREIRRILDVEGQAVRENTTHFNEQRYRALESFDRYESLRDDARARKEHAIAHLPELLKTVTEAVEANGGSVHVAEDAADANRYIESVVRKGAAETAVKSKSMTTEEIHLNDHLETLGVDVYETDLGEFVIQLAEEAPSHLIGPAIHKSRDEIAALFNEVFDPPEPLRTSEELTRFARDYLGEQIRGADIGITGANFVLAESGTIVLVTNEGNARKTAVVPRTHIAVTGIEKLLPSITDLGPFIELIARAGTGQDITQYVSLFSPPVETPVIDFDCPDTANFGGGTTSGDSGSSDRTFHLVLLDNGRNRLRDDPDLRETLYCIRCGACANTCANFQSVGGHVFGGETYTGGIAAGWETGVNGVESTASFTELCTGCTRCIPACPVKIDIPWINTVVRDRLNQGDAHSRFDSLVSGLLPDDEPDGLSVRQRAFGHFGQLARLGSATAPVSNWIGQSRVARAALDRFLGIDRRRSLPSFQRPSFRAWYADRGSANPDADRAVVVYPDVYTNFIQVERGKSAVRVLESLGYRVIVPDVTESGRGPLSQGMVQTAQHHANAVVAAFEPYLEAGHDVLVIEPSDLAMFKREYARLIDPPSYDRLAARSYDLFEYLDSLDRLEPDHQALQSGIGERIVFHGHCQQRTLGVAEPTRRVLERLGYDVDLTAVECCGMAGSFGYKSEYYDISMRVGEALQDQLDDAAVVTASGTSCLEQLVALGIDHPIHPIQIIDPADR